MSIRRAWSKRNLPRPLHCLERATPKSNMGTSESRAQHVEACELCQQRLMYMSSMESNELEVSKLLNGFVTLNDKHSQTGFEQPSSHGLGQHDVLLGPPSQLDFRVCNISRNALASGFRRGNRC